MRPDRTKANGPKNDTGRFPMTGGEIALPLSRLWQHLT